MRFGSDVIKAGDKLIPLSELIDNEFDRAMRQQTLTEEVLSKIFGGSTGNNQDPR